MSLLPAMLHLTAQMCRGELCTVHEGDCRGRDVIAHLLTAMSLRVTLA